MSKMIQKIFYIFWKNLLIRKNHYIATILEVLLPVSLLILTNISLPKQESGIDNDAISFEAFKDIKCFPGHSHYDSIMYEPSTPFLDLLMTKAACYAGYKKSSVLPGKLSDNNSYFSIGVKFEGILQNTSITPSALNYTLFTTNKAFINLKALWRHSGHAIPRFSIPTLYAVVELQRAIDTSYLHLKEISATKLLLENTDLFGRGPRVFSYVVYFSVFIAFTFTIPHIISRIVAEKSSGAKELMLMMGVARYQLWVAKFIDVMLFMFITVSGMVFFLFVPLRQDSNCLTISPLTFWCVIMYGLTSVTLFLFCMSCLFDKTSVAVYVTLIIWVISFTFNNFISDWIQVPSLIKYLICVIPHISLMQGFSILVDFDFYGKSVKFTERLSGKEDALSLLGVFSMMTINILLYAVLTWYLEQVKPGKYGVPQPYNFCFKKCYWFPSKVLISCNSTSPNNSQSNFEPVPPNLRVGVSLQNVCKVFTSLDKGVVTAVDNVNLNFYHSEISALLGHNGAGKTTVFSMITGLSYPTSGKVIINGYDLGVNVEEARRSLGLCPQKDMLFDDLTPLQILKFYGVIKGLTLKQAQKEAVELITKLKLINVRNTQASSLSGGQKRKVSLAGALIGGSEVLVLDEPTAGMDPEIRREIWEILLGFRGMRTILLTTHFMEEADALCDRIAIMDHGTIKCHGSPMFLKSKFGKGYILNVVAQDLNSSKELVNYVKELIPTGKFKSQNIRTLTFELPESEVSVFPKLLSGLEEKQTKTEIASYCISLSTLEDVFLRLRSSHEATDDFDTIDSPPYKALDITEELDFQPPKCFLFLSQFWALIFKKWTFFKRSYKSFLVYSILPALIVVLMALLSTKNSLPDQMTDLSGQKPLTYSLSLYPSSLVLYSGLSDESEKQLFRDLVKSDGSHAREATRIKDAISAIFKNDFYTYSKEMIFGIDFSNENPQIYHNEEAVHMVPISINFIHNFLLKSRYKNESIVTSMNIRYANKDLLFLPRSSPKCSVENLPNFSGIQTLFYLLAPAKERFCGAKGIQLMMVAAPLYWLSHFLFDAATFSIYITIIYASVGLLERDSLMLEHAGEIGLGFLFWGCGLIQVSYVISRVIKDRTAALSVNVVVYVLFSFVIYNVISLEGLPKFFQYLDATCILKFGLKDLCNSKRSNFIYALILYNCLLFTFLVLKDSKLLSQVVHGLANRFYKVIYSHQEKEDEFVKEEAELVKKLINKENLSGSALIVNDLRRWYLKGCRPSPAVRGISFTVNKGECFGLLGVNGAGKTSTFKILTGAIPPSHGSAYVCSQRLSFLNRAKYLFSIGYCPQFGGLLPMFTGKEILNFFARLRGISRSRAEEEVNKWLEKMNILEYAGQKCGSYSGGNQRKLSTAIALIGDSPLIFLDEPTTGVDPLSRRSIWNVIGDIQKEGQSVVLTSHSMDECEALCSRLAIMVNGRFRCLGETTTLKDRFGQGYCVQLKISTGAPEETVRALKMAVAAAFEPGCELVDEHLTVLQYHVTNKSVCWADLFTTLNGLKENYSILESFTASATTLEQIFIHFARHTDEGV